MACAVWALIGITYRGVRVSLSSRDEERRRKRRSRRLLEEASRSLNRFPLATPTLGDSSGRGSSSSVDSHEIRLLFLTLGGHEEERAWPDLVSFLFPS